MEGGADQSRREEPRPCLGDPAVSPCAVVVDETAGVRDASPTATTVLSTHAERLGPIMSLARPSDFATSEALRPTRSARAHAAGLDRRRGCEDLRLELAEAVIGVPLHPDAATARLCEPAPRSAGWSSPRGLATPARCTVIRRARRPVALQPFERRAAGASKNKGRRHASSCAVFSGHSPPPPVTGSSGPRRAADVRDGLIRAAQVDGGIAPNSFWSDGNFDHHVIANPPMRPLAPRRRVAVDKRLRCRVLALERERVQRTVKLRRRCKRRRRGDVRADAGGSGSSPGPCARSRRPVAAARRTDAASRGGNGGRHWRVVQVELGLHLGERVQEPCRAHGRAALAGPAERRK